MTTVQYKKRWTYFENDDFTLSLEEANGELYVHLALDHVSKTSINEVRRVWEEIKYECFWLGYENIYSYTSDMRVVKLFEGWSPIGKVNYNETEYEIVRWELK